MESIKKLRKFMKMQFMPLTPAYEKSVLIADEIEREIAELQESWAQESREHAEESMKLADLAHENAKLKREIAELQPLDADGVPIRPGDLLDPPKDSEEYGRLMVTELTYDGEDWYFKGEIPASFTGQAGYFNVLGFTHVKPDPVKELLEEFANNGTPTGNGGVLFEAGLIERYAAKIRQAVES